MVACGVADVAPTTSITSIVGVDSAAIVAVCVAAVGVASIVSGLLPALEPVVIADRVS